MTPPPPDSANRGRLSLVLAAVLWSLSGLFTRLLQKETALGVHQPALTPLQIAFYRALFAGLVFVPLLRRRDLTFRPLMPVMVACFAGMNALFLMAMALGPAANAILLQNTAPFWVYLACVYALGEHSDRRSRHAILIGMAGVAIIVGGGWARDGAGNVEVTAMGLGSGFLYGAVILCLRALRGYDSMWLTAQNHLGSALALGAAVFLLHGATSWLAWVTTPGTRQLALLAFFGVVQMGLPYLLFAKGLRSVSPQEAGAITLLEPLLNPFWAYLVSPETDTPPPATWVGGALILGALAWRYLPRRGAINRQVAKSA
jgi:DME family drug/metabolite transporter